MNRTAAHQPADTRTMGIVHSALRRDLARARAVLTEAPHPYDEQRIAIAEHLLWIMRWLHEHHEAEDEGLYPLVRKHNPHAGALLDLMDEDHQSMIPAIAEMEDAAGEYRESPDARLRVLAAIDRLAEVAYPHLDREENEMMPVVSASITRAQWDEWDQAYNIKPKGFVELCDAGNWVLDGLAPDERTVIEGLVPAIPRWIITHPTSPRYRRAAYARWRLPEHSPYRVTMDGRAEVVVEASPERVWRVLADVARTGEWSHECRSAQWLDGVRQPVAGARFRGRSASGLFRWSRPCTVTASEPGRVFEFVTGGAIPGRTVWRFELTPVADGTRIVQVYRVLRFPVWLERCVWWLVPSHRDRSEALRGDLERLGRVAQREPTIDGRLTVDPSP